MGARNATIRFEGETHQMEAFTLIDFLTHYCATICRIGDMLNDGSRKLTVKVNALSKGSFLIDLSITETILQSLFSSNAVTFPASVVTIAQGVTCIYRKLKGRPVKDIEEVCEIEGMVELENSTAGSKVTLKQVVKAYNDKAVRKAISASYKTLREDEGVEGVRMGFNGKEGESVGRDEFEGLCYDDFDTEDGGKERIVTEEAVLTIQSLSFDSAKKWVFLRDGKRLAMTIDEKLAKRVEDGERFGKGDRLRVRMEVTLSPLGEIDGYCDKAYRMLECKEHIPATRQGSLFD